MSKRGVDFSTPIIAAAVKVAREVSARALFCYVHAVDDLPALQKAVQAPTELVLVARDEKDQQRAKDAAAKVITVPAFDLTRMDQIKMATLIALSQQVLQAGDVFVFLAGVVEQGLDTTVVMRMGEEYELFRTVGQPKLTEHIRRVVFEKVLTLALELAHEGREGKSVGALFVLGDYREVQKVCQEGRINPFKGYTEKERNILDDSMRDTVKELAKLDGAFIIKGNGVIASAGTILAAGAGRGVPAAGARSPARRRSRHHRQHQERRHHYFRIDRRRSRLAPRGHDRRDRACLPHRPYPSLGLHRRLIVCAIGVAKVRRRVHSWPARSVSIPAGETTAERSTRNPVPGSRRRARFSYHPSPGEESTPAPRMRRRSPETAAPQWAMNLAESTPVAELDKAAG